MLINLLGPTEGGQLRVVKNSSKTEFLESQEMEYTQEPLNHIETN